MPDMLTFKEAREILGPIRVWQANAYREDGTVHSRNWFLDGRRATRAQIILAAWERLRQKWGEEIGGGSPGPRAA